MHVAALTLRDFRNHERAEVDLRPASRCSRARSAPARRTCWRRSTSAASGRSFRTSNERELIRFGERGRPRRGSTTDAGGAEHGSRSAIERGGPKVIKRRRRARRSGSPTSRPRPLVCVFAPTGSSWSRAPAGRAPRPSRRGRRRRSGRPAARRARVTPVRSRSATPARPGAGRARRPRIAGGLEPRAGSARDRADGSDRREAVELLSPRFAARADELGLAGAGRARLPAALPRRRRADELEQRARASIWPADLERGFTTHGPHRDELALRPAARELRRFGSQGQQRLALLALLLAERDVLATARRARRSCCSTTS